MRAGTSSRLNLATSAMWSRGNCGLPTGTAIEMRVLVGCECSGIVRDAFARLGHDAWSCDLLPSQRPGQHIQGDLLKVIKWGGVWDLGIYHPECTYIALSG